MNDDKDVAAHSVVIHYTSPILDGRNTQQQHGEYVGFAEDPTLSDPALPLLIDAREARTVRIRDARTRTEAFTLPNDGFQLCEWPTQVADFDDSEAVVREYVPEMQGLVSAAMHASSARGVQAVVVWDLCLRTSELDNEFQVAVQASDAQRAGSGLDTLAPVSLVHADFFSPADVRRRLQQRWATPTDTLSTFMRADFALSGLTASDLEACVAGRARVVSVNVWRSIDRRNPVRRCPLGLCDPASLVRPRDELVPFQIVCPDASFAKAHVLAHQSDAHRWYHYPHMRDDECLVFVSGDTAQRWPAVPHTSFDDPRTRDGDPPRRSIEARCFVIFKDHVEQEEDSDKRRASRSESGDRPAIVCCTSEIEHRLRYCGLSRHV